MQQILIKNNYTTDVIHNEGRQLHENTLILIIYTRELISSLPILTMTGRASVV